MKRLIIYLIIFFAAGIAYGQNIPRPDIPAPKGLSVNSFTGNLVYQRTDMTIRGTGFPIYVSFNYNAAHDTLDYGFGHGWSFYYNIFYISRSDTVIFHGSGAKRDTFYFQSGSYRSPVGVYDVLTKSGNEYTLQKKDGIKYIFSDTSHKKITRMTDPNNNALSFTYVNKQLASISNASGRGILLAWENSNLKSIADSLNPAKKFLYQYDEKKDLVSITNPLSAKLFYTYDSHFLLRIVDENNNPVVISYASTGKVKTINSCNSGQQFTFVDLLRKTYVTESGSGGTVVNGFTFDDQGRINEIMDAQYNTSSFSYDGMNNLTEWTDWNGGSTRYEYDAKGNLLREIDPLGGSTAYTYEPVFNKVTSVTDKNSNVTNFIYDATGNLVTLQRTGNITETYSYDSQGRIATITNPNNEVTTYQYDSNGDLTRIIHPIGEQLFEYNGSCCNLSKITDPNGTSITMTYDLMNRTKTVTDVLGNLIQYDYDAAGNLIKEMDLNGIAKNYGYDAANRLTSVQLPAGTWHYEYDGQNNLTSLKDANGNITTYQYNPKNQLILETDPIGNSTAYTYDANGNLLMKTDPVGNTISYKYNALNQLLEKTYPGNTDKYNYDANGNLAGAYNNNIAYSFEYDALKRLLKKNIITWNKSIAYTYDAAGNRKTMTDHDGGLTQYVYDGNNRLAGLTNPSNLVTTFVYDPGGRIILQNNGNTTYSTYHYDAAGRMDSLINWRSSSEKVSFFYYTFDQYGNRTSMTDKRGLHTYTYDSSYRLTNVIYADSSTENFTIDPVGNRTQRIKNGIPTLYSYNAANQLGTGGASSYIFDASGNMIAQNDSLQQTFNYDGENRLVEVFLNSKKMIFRYGPFGEKIEKQDTSHIISRMLYDGNNLLGELSTTNSSLSKYTTGLGMDSWLSIESGTENYFFLKDGLNSTVELTSLDATISNEYYYDAYGNIIGKTGNIKNPVLYTGRFFEDAIKMYDLRNRYYNPLIGRFTTKDKFGGNLTVPVSINGYAYTENNPTNYVDPLGLWTSLPYRFYKILGRFNPITDNKHRGSNNGNLVNCDQIAEIFDNFSNGNERYFDNDKRYIETDYGLVDLQHIYYSANPLTEYGIRKPGIINRLLGANGVGVIGGILVEYKQYKSDDESGWSIEDFISNHVGKRAANNSFWPGKTLDQAVQDELTKMGGCKPPPPESPNEPPPGTPDSPLEPFRIPIIRPSDPNEIIGPAGYSDTQWVSVKSIVPYKVLFENDPDFATAPAQKVIIYLPIHARLSPGSIRLGDFGFGRFNFTVPENTSVYSSRLDLRDSLGLFVDITAGLDMTNRRAFWIFQSIDPTTGLPNTLAADKGFLAVNDSTLRNGEGFVTLTILPSLSAHTRDSITADASIIFDSEETIATNKWFNIIDAVAPTSEVTTLSALVDSVFTISWTGADDSLGAGIRDYALYYSKNNGPYILYRKNIDSTHLLFKGENGATYSFYTIATDNTGNEELPKTAGEQTVTVKGNGLFVSIKAFLQGGYNPSNGLMIDSLRTMSLLSATEPYRLLGFTPVNNPTAEAAKTGVLDSTENKAITDWVWLELRNSSNPSQIAATRSALIRRDGNIVDMDGHSPVYFNNTAEGNYYIALRHRNHFGIMTAAAFNLSKTDTLSIDFTNPATATYGTNARRNLNGVMVMWAGDINKDGKIKYNGSSNDKVLILSKVGVANPNNVLVAYDATDLNLDGKVKYNGSANDKTIILNNVGVATPNNVLTEQLPN